MVYEKKEKPLLPLAILVCGVIGGLVLVITLIFCCKYCIGKNRKFCLWRRQRVPYQLPDGMSIELPLTGEKHHFIPIREESQVPLKPESEIYDSDGDELQPSHRSSCALKMEPLLDFPSESQMSDVNMLPERGQTSNGNIVCVEDSPGTHIKNSSQKPSAKLRKTANYSRRYTNGDCDNRNGSPNFNDQHGSRTRSVDIDHLARLKDISEWDEKRTSPECKPRPTLQVQKAITRTPSPCDSPHMSEVAVQFHKDVEGRSHPYDDKLDSSKPYINRDVYHDDRELPQMHSFQTPWVSSSRNAHSFKPKPTLQNIRPLSAEYYIDSKYAGFRRGIQPPEIEVDDQTDRLVKQQDYRELWKLRATFELEESTSNSSEPDTVITANQQIDNISQEYDVSTIKRRYHSMDDSKDRLLVQQKHKLHARTKDDSFDLAFSSISTEESDTSDRSKGQSGDSSGREGGRNLRQMQGDSGYASIEQKCMSEQKRYLYAMSDKESTSIESYVPSLSSESSPIREYLSLVKDTSTEVEDDVEKCFTHHKRGDSRTASKKRRQFTSGKGEAIDDSFSFPEDESEADSQSASTYFDSASDASLNLGSDSQSESSSVRRKFGRLGRFFRSHRDDRFQYYFKRDYSIDEKTDKIFKEFLRQDSMFDTPSTYKSRRNRRLRISRKQHSDSLLDTPRKILEVPDSRDLRSASEDYTVEFWTRKSGPSVPSGRSRMSSRKFVLQQDSIEEEFLREERKRILGEDDPLPVETTAKVARAPVVWDTIPEWRSSEPERLDGEAKRDRIIKSDDVRLNIDEAVEGNRCSAFKPVGKRSPQLPRTDVRVSPSRNKQSVIEPSHNKQCGLDSSRISPQMDEICFSGSHLGRGGRGRGEMMRNLYSDNQRVMSIPVLLAPDDDQPKKQKPLSSRHSPRHSPRLSSHSRSLTVDSATATTHIHKFSCSPTLTIELAEDNAPAEVYASDKKRSRSFEEHRLTYRESMSGGSKDYELDRESSTGMSFLDVPSQRERPHSASSLTRLKDESRSPLLERRHSTEFTMDGDQKGHSRKDLNYRTSKPNRHQFHSKRISSENSISMMSRSSGDTKRASGRTQSALDVFAAQEPYIDRRDRSPLRFPANREVRYSKQPPGTSRRSDINRGRETGRDRSPSEPYHGFD